MIRSVDLAAPAKERSVAFCVSCHASAALSNRHERRSKAMPERRELYRTPNGDTWFLGREPTSGRAFVIHQPNAPSGGRLSHIELGEFLRSGSSAEQQALLRLIGSLVDVPPYA